MRAHQRRPERGVPPTVMGPAQSIQLLVVTRRSACRSFADPLREQPLVAGERWQAGVQGIRVRSPMLVYVGKQQGVPGGSQMGQPDARKMCFPAGIVVIQVDQECVTALSAVREFPRIGRCRRVEVVVVCGEVKADRRAEVSACTWR